MQKKSPRQILYGVILVGVSLGLHGVFLALPVPDNKPEKISEDSVEEIDPETLISVTKLPPPIQNEPPAEPEQAPPAAPQPPPPAAQTPPPAAPPPAVAPTPEPEPSAPPPETPPPETPPPETPPPETPPPETPPPETPPTRFPENFQHLTGTQPCGNGLEDCHTYNEFGSFSKVRRHLKAQFEQKGYRVTEDNTFDAQGEQVFKLTKDNDIRYLNILSFFDQTAGQDIVVYTVTEQIAMNELKQEYGVS